MAQVDPYNPLVPDQTALNEVKYACRDFVSMADDLLRRLKVAYEADYNDYATTAIAIMLRDLVAWAHENLQWYMDRTASDCFLRTARTSSAVERLVEQIGYKMTPAASAGATSKLTFPNGTTAGFTMPARWRFSGPDGFQFESFADTLVTGPIAVGGTLDVDVRQGETRVLTYTADGTKNQTYRLTSVPDGKYLAVNAVDVWVDGSLWEERDFLEFDSDVPNHYEISYQANPPIVRFGDGIAGAIPPVGAEVKLRFLVIDGEAGNVKAGTIATSIDSLVVGGSQVTFTVTNEDAASGGVDPEEMDMAKTNAPVSFSARGAAITQPDYAGLSNSYNDPRYGRVARAYAFNPRGSYEDIVFDGYVSDISVLIDLYRATVDSLENAVVVSSQSLTPLLASLTASSASLSSLNSTLQGYVGSALAGVNTARGEASMAQNSASTSKANCQQSVNDIDALITWINGTGEISGIGKTILKDGNGSIAGLNEIRSSVNLAQNESLNAETYAGAVVSDLDSVANLQLEPASVIVNTTIPAIIVQIGSDVDDIDDVLSDPTSGLQAQLNTIIGLAADLEGDIDPVLTNMQIRIGELFSDDCKSNYVQVPILSLNHDGDYVSPSVGLMRGLQGYLDEIKEVTQYVEVVDGSSVLVGAEIEMELEVLDGFVAADVVSQIRASVVRLLKGRDFNSPLYLDALYEVSKASSTGIKRINIEIVGPSMVPTVIVNGNLVPPSNRIIVLGSLTINVVS